MLRRLQVPVNRRFSNVNMGFFIAFTDDWARLHAAKQNVEELNFWRPSPETGFKALHTGEVLLFQLHAPRNFIAGGTFFRENPSLPTFRALHRAYSGFPV